MKNKSTLFSIAFVAIAVVVYGALILTGKVANPFGGAEGGGQSVLSGSGLSADEMYYQLGRLMSDPDRDTKLSGKFTFTTYIADEPVEMEFDEDPGVVYQYQAAYIARSEKYYLLDVKDLKEPLEPGNYYRVTAELNGSVYWTEDGKKVNVLDISASKAEPFARSEAEPNEGPDYEVGNVTYTFAGAHYCDLGHNRQGIVVYFDYTNNGDSDATPVVHDLSFYQGSSGRPSSIASSSDKPKEYDTKALAAFAPGLTDKTYAGKTGRYYTVVRPQQDVAEDEDTLWVARFNDDYELTDDIGMQIFKDYKAWAK